MSDGRHNLRPGHLFLAAAAKIRTGVEPEPSCSKLMRPGDDGRLAGTVTQKVQAAFVGEVTLDLTKTPDGELVAHLKDLRYAL